ncbi:MAG TPA: IS4 family transposase [Mycobacterium sp.]|uniref:IS4 family transposase n=1 Tax=Mycobacterium sp. TaxID=1785 RepID=UPI002F4237FA
MITVAQGRFAPGHLGELTQIVPFEMVDQALAETGTVQARLRDLPSRVVVYLLLAGSLFAEVGYAGVWQKLVAGLDGLLVATPSASALCQARRRVGVKPLRFLFGLLCGPAVSGGLAGSACVRWRGLLVCAIDGTTMSVPDSAANLARYGRQGGTHGGSGYPLLRLLAVVSCGTRTVIDAVFGPTSIGETSQAPQLLGCLRPGMLLLADRNFAAAGVITAITQTGAQVLIRCKANRKLPVLRRHPDGSYLSRWGETEVRVVEAEITIQTLTGRRTGSYRLITTLLDAGHYPALEIVELYHQRWEIETAFLELKSTILGGRVLRARTPAGIDQEVYALLTTYQALRLAMAEATDSQPGLDPDRACFTTALHTARDLLIQAAGVIADTTIDLVGGIGRLVLANLLPDRRTRTSPRAIKRATSKHAATGIVNRTSYKATITIDILNGEPPGPQPNITN